MWSSLALKERGALLPPEGTKVPALYLAFSDTTLVAGLRQCIIQPVKGGSLNSHRYFRSYECEDIVFFSVVFGYNQTVIF